ncbi:hypothetical protein GCM10010442_50540 [Kitasatospora kifunensis]
MVIRHETMEVGRRDSVKSTGLDSEDAGAADTVVEYGKFTEELSRTAYCEESPPAAAIATRDGRRAGGHDKHMGARVSLTE